MRRQEHIAALELVVLEAASLLLLGGVFVRAANRVAGDISEIENLRVLALSILLRF